MGKVHYLNDIFYASCPECGSQEWLLIVDGPGNEFQTITGFECKYCEFVVDWVKPMKES